MADFMFFLLLLNFLYFPLSFSLSFSFSPSLLCMSLFLPVFACLPTCLRACLSIYQWKHNSSYSMYTFHQCCLSSVITIYWLGFMITRQIDYLLRLQDNDYSLWLQYTSVVQGVCASYICIPPPTHIYSPVLINLEKDHCYFNPLFSR